MTLLATVDCVVVGAGVVGLAIARSLALHGRDVLVIEKENTVGAGISSRNSEVIHSGIYYPKNSLKAQLCVQGRDLLYAYAQNKYIPYQNLGKLVVANDEDDLIKLDQILARAHENGVYDARKICGEEATRLEPELRCRAALFSPSTGVIDSYTLMQSLLRDAEAAGAMLALQNTVNTAQIMNDGIILELTERNEEKHKVKAKKLINSAGLNAPILARGIQGLPNAFKPRNHDLAKGNYFTCREKPPFRHLIYPVPQNSGALGVHLTLDVHGHAKFGPDLQWIDTESYDVDPQRADAFSVAIRKYWPRLPDNSLIPDYAGIRPKIQRPGGDFCIQAFHSTIGITYLGLLAIESPGLTASLAIAEYVRQLLL